MDREAFKEALLHVMERKEHWAWPGFTGGLVPADRLHVHLEQEWEVYVRDFPVMVGRAYVQCPIAAVRRDLAENLYEEETGGLVAGRPHPELFLEYPKGLGMDLARFESVTLLPAAAAYREAVDAATEGAGWSRAAAVTTIFLEGTKYDRGELEDAPKRPAPPLSEHPLVKHYGLPLEHLALTKAHRQVEGSHRADAWAMMLDHVPEADRDGVIEAMETVLQAWQAYRDAVAEACGLTRGDDGQPRLASAA
ncbi:MAG: iron-containing redox enzyme family protein [Deltaproteobacteria bacterium]|nr:iron-containing redox enzyme family protein [Deltaproteobacteria bacterium]